MTYGGLLQERRRELHARIVNAIETLHGNRLGGEIERLAHHALRGELREKAVDYLRQAGGKAAARSAPQDARLWFEHALGALEALPESQATLEQAFEIRLELRPVMQQLGEGRRMLERLREAEVLAERLNDDHRRGRVCALATNDHSRLGELDEALVTGTRALEIAGRLGDLRLRILTTSFLGQVHYYRGEYGRAVELATGNLTALPADETTRHAFTLGVAHWAAFTLRLRKGDWAKARSLIEHEIAVLRALGEASEALNRLREGDQRASAGWPATTSPSRRRCAARWGWRADWSRPRRNGA